MREFVRPANLVTSGNLAAGFGAIVLVGHHRLGWATALIVVAAICDSFDGLVARYTVSEGPFGSRLDSLADLVSFGAAPALVLYAGALSSVPVAGIGACMAFVLCGGWRLARFALIEDRDFFVGLPIPPSGMFGAILAISGLPPVLLCTVTFAGAALMASTVRFPTLATLFRSLLRARAPRPRRAREAPRSAASEASERAPHPTRRRAPVTRLRARGKPVDDRVGDRARAR